MKNNERLDNIRHSAAHLLAQAVLELYPDTKLTIGPTTENGFFYDFLPLQNFKEEDLSKIENKMHELSKKNYPIIGKQVSKEEARKLFAGNEFKQELLDGIADGTVGVYSQGDFYDLCKGGHVESTGQIKYFKLTSLAGSYWRAERDNAALQRIYGIAFETQNDLDLYLKRLEEAKLYDHRRLGKQLDLFSFHEEAPANVFFHDKGTRIFNKLIERLRKMQYREGYQEIKTPMIMKEVLWRTSGHYDNYKENMFFTKADEDIYCVRPMNCPGGVLLFKEKQRSYKELPLKMAEFGFVHRLELSGVLHGLFRVRGFTQDDAHIYCTQEQMVDQVVQVIDLIDRLYKPFNFTEILMAVSTRPEKAMGSDQLWEKATNALKEALDKKGLKYRIKEGEGAFYGPKIEVAIKDSMGREWQCGTVQVDFNLPQNFKLEYIDSDQSRKTPIMIHRALYGSIERFMGVVIEHLKGNFPFWLAPIQVRILTITDQQKDYAKKVFEKMLESGLYVEIDESGDQISKQIKMAQEQKIPWMLVIGKKEEENGTVTLRHADGKQEFDLNLDELIAKALELNKL